MPGRRRGNNVSVLEAIATYSDVSPTKFLVAVACVIAMIDIGCAVALYGEVHSWDAGAWWPLAILKNTWDKESYTKDSADIILLVITRLAILPAIAGIAATKGKPPEISPARPALETNNGHNANLDPERSWWRRCWRRRSRSSRGSSESRRQGHGRSLLDLTALEGGSTQSDSTLYLPLIDSGDATAASPLASPKASEEKAKEAARVSRDEEEDRRKQSDAILDRAKGAAVRRKTLLLGFLFSASTAMQVYTGVKCVRFRFTKEISEGTLMGLGVLWLNIMVWALTGIVAEATKEEGFLQPLLHPHRLYPTSKMAGHNCDVCRIKIKNADARAWRCKLCDFDLCLSCYEKKDIRAMEGVLRGDRGMRQEVDLPTLGYFRRALGLAKPHWPLFTMAFTCLAVSNSTNLALPNFTGGILDRVVQNDADGFKRYIILLVTLSAVTGTIGSLKSLCFSVAGRKMALGARNKLFAGVISQDVAFFDGTTTGKLTSLLSSDVNAMVSPCTYMLGTLFSNLLLLFGGMVMCFVTSWRLSMLAFTTVGPVYHITQVYARWSQQLNKQIYAAYAEANGHATEALGNVRTVKAMSTESLEMSKHNKATKVALEKGIKDAFGSAGTYAFNSYLDQGAGALILWYGGSLAMDGEDRMTAGRLITYQMYWNMINSAWQTLINIVSNFTQAAGAAQRVFTLMDSLPDIDTNKGIVLKDRTFRGEIAIEGVQFAYQMRPDNQVLKGVDLHIPAGTTCALVGRSGGGKSTLVHLLLRFYDPQVGRILVDGIPLTDLQLKSLHRKTAIVAQDTQLFACSIYENITYGLDEDFREEDVFEAARQACAHEFITSFPDGYRTRVGERGTRLSGGQKQRVAIARALMRKPRILLLDEATSSLDAESEASVQQALDTLVEKGAGSTTIVLVAHRLSTVMNAQNIAVMDKGQCIEQGTHEALMKAGGVYSSLVARQISRAANTLQQEANSSRATQRPADIDTLMDELDAKRAICGPGVINIPNSGNKNGTHESSNGNVPRGRRDRGKRGGVRHRGERGVNGGNGNGREADNDGYEM